MQAIMTKWISRTATRGPRISARSGSGIAVVIPYDPGYSDYENHERAARKLMEKLGWTGKIAGGSLPGSSPVFAWVFCSEARDPRDRDRGWFKQPVRHRRAARLGLERREEKAESRRRRRRA